MSANFQSTGTERRLLLSIQPTQLYISKSKLDNVLAWMKAGGMDCFAPIPIKELNGRIIFTDGHTRAYAAYTLGLREIPVYWDTDELDWEAYQRCVEQCELEGIQTIADLQARVVNDADYRALWDAWCDRLHEELERQRAQAKARAAGS